MTYRTCGRSGLEKARFGVPRLARRCGVGGNPERIRRVCCLGGVAGRYLMWMTRSVRQSDAGGLSPLLVLAIGLQLMLSGAGLAAGACGESLERVGVRRLSEQVVQAFRELSERAAVRTKSPGVEPDWAETPRVLAGSGAPCERATVRLSAWVLSTAPPVA